jgi:hypothetical protein
MLPCSLDPGGVECPPHLSLPLLTAMMSHSDGFHVQPVRLNCGEASSWITVWRFLNLSVDHLRDFLLVLLHIEHTCCLLLE